MIETVDTWTFRRVVWATLILIAVALGFWLLYNLIQVLFILFIAIVAGTVVRPAVSWLYSRGVPRIIGAIFVYLLLLTLVVGFLMLIFPVVAEQGGTIFASLPGYYQTMRDWMVSSTNPLIQQLSEFLPDNLLDPELAEQSGPEMLSAAGQALGFVSTAANIVFTGSAVLLLAFYWTLYGPRSIQSLLRLIPSHSRDRTRDLVAAMETKVSAYIAGQGLLGLIVGIMALAAYMLIGLPFPLVLALVAGVMEMVPMVGPLLGAVPAVIIALAIDPSKVIWVIAATVVIQQVENSLLVPRVMRKAVGVNPFVSILSIFAFSSLFGIAGALMAIPIAAILQLMLDRYVFEPGSLDPEISTGRDYASRLRLDAQNLVQDLRKQTRLKKGGSDQSVIQADLLLEEIETLASDLDLVLAETSITRQE